MKTNKKQILIFSHNLHGYSGHEYMYTKELLNNLTKNLKPIVVGRKDINEVIRKELNVIRVFSTIDYNQEQSLPVKFFKLLEREIKWFYEFRDFLKKNKLYKGDIIFIHSFSIYNTWSWIYFSKYFAKRGVKFLLLFRYSELLLPRLIRPLHRLICNLLPKENDNIQYLTDSRNLTEEYSRFSEINLAPGPVMAKTHINEKRILTERKGEICLSYLGAARSDKGFYLLPDLVDKILSSSKYKLKINIQASLPGTKYIDKKCGQAIEKLKLISNRNNNLKLHLEQLTDEKYNDLLLTTDIMLLPYTGVTYKVQTSGVLIESMANGIPCIVPNNSWMEEELKKTKGGISCNVESKKELYNALVDLIEDIDIFSKNAVLGSDNVRKEHGPSALANFIENKIK